MTTGRLRTLMAAAAGTLLLSACGSTVQPGLVANGTAGSTSAGNGALSAGPGGVGVGGSTAGSASVPGHAAGLAAVGGTAPGTTSGVAASGAQGGSAAHRPAGPVEVGVEYFDSSQAVATGKQVGYSVNPGDPYAEAQALVAWVNAHGGFAGHQIRPVYFQFDNTASQDTNEQSACAAWTQDHHVLAAIWPNNFSPDNVLITCLAKAGVMLTGGADTYLNSPQLAAEHGYLQTPYMFAGERMYQALVDRLVATGWLSKTTKIGVLSDDGNTYAANVQTIKQRLAQHGLAVTDTATISETSTNLDPSQCQSAGLHFASDGVTNIIVADDGARAFLYCTPVFRSQQYYPKMSITSYDSPSTVQSLIPASSLNGSAGIGWEPVNDVASFTPNTSGNLCLSIMRGAGLNVAAAAFEEAIAFAYCDGFFFFHQAYASANSPTAASVQAAIAGFADHYTSPITFRTNFATGRYDGAGAVADLIYSSPCSCYRYQDAPRHIN